MRMIKILLFTISIIVLFTGILSATDWYVAAGSDGEGTKESPFDDPQRAIDSASSGDVIHVTQGDYYGKFKVGYLVIDKRGLTLVGGYKDKTFTERNPFKYPTFIKQNLDSKNSTFDGSDIRVKEDHWSTTVDGFWFDRKEQNGYGPLNAPPDQCPGCLSVPLGSNTKPVIIFENPDCHILNCVFMNTALYAVRVTGDGSSIENNLFLNTNYCGIDIYGKGERIEKGRFHKILIKNNTFVSAWNARSMERAAGSFIFQGGNADITIINNIFHLSNGNSSSMGYAVKDERNFKADKWIHFLGNSISQLRGGIASIYITDLKASINIDFLKDFRDTPWEAKDNDEENPFFNFDKEWFDDYSKAIPKDDPSSKKINMDDFNKMRRMLGLPLDGGTVNLGGAYLARYYPIEHVKTGAFFKSSNEKLKSRGIQTEGSFQVIRGKLIADKGSNSSENENIDNVNRDYKEIDWDTLWTKGESLIDQAVKIKAYYMGNDTNFNSISSSKVNIDYLKDANKNTHIIILLRKVEEMTSKEYPIKGFIVRGSEGENYIDKKARRSASDKKVASDDSFFVYGVVKKAGDKVNMGVGPQIVIAIDTITGE